MGMGGLDKQLEKQKTDSYWDLLLNSETARYVNRIVAIKTIMNDPDKYGFHIRKNDLYPFVGTNTVEVDTTIDDLVIFAYHNGINYKILKDFNPWLRKDILPNKSGRNYKIKIPVTGYRNFNIPDSLRLK